MKAVCMVVAVVLGASMLAACGDDEDESGGPLTKAQFIAQGDAICGEANATFNKLFETDFPTTRAAMPGFFSKVTPIERDRLKELRALEGPAADRARIATMLASADRALDDFQKAGRNADYGARLFAQQGGANSRAFERQAKAYGFKRCSEDEGDTSAAESKVDTSSFSAEKRAYIKKVDAVCARSNRRFSALEGRYLKSFPPPLAVWGKFLAEIAKVSRQQIAAIEAIAPPEAEAAKVVALSEKQKDLSSQFEQAGKLAAAKDEQGFRRVSQKMFAGGEAADAELRAYGFRECGDTE